MTQTRIYVAGPMTGLPEYNYPAFHAAKAALLGAGYEAISPADAVPGDPPSWVDYMRKTIRMLLECDAVAVLNGWEDSRGASLEVHIADALELPVKPLAFWLA